MTDVASGEIRGPEARGRVRVVAAADGTRIIEATDLWVAPGAPDVRLYASRDREGAVGDASIELGPVADGRPEQRWQLPADVGPDTAVSIVVYCHVYSVYFGHAVLSWTAD